MAGEKGTKKQKKVATRNNLLGKYEAGVYIFSVHTLILSRGEKREEGEIGSFRKKLSIRFLVLFPLQRSFSLYKLILKNNPFIPFRQNMREIFELQNIPTTLSNDINRLFRLWKK